jgi:hypothetical protein
MLLRYGLKGGPPTFKLPPSSNPSASPTQNQTQVQQGLAAGAAKEEVYLMPATARHEYAPELHAATCVLRLVEGYT